jgi:ATP-dependent Zn protease
MILFFQPFFSSPFCHLPILCCPLTYNTDPHPSSQLSQQPSRKGAAKRSTGVKYDDVAGIDHIKSDVQVGGTGGGVSWRG